MSAPTGSAARAGAGELASALAAQEDRLGNCVHCGFCLPACPTYLRLHDEADSPRGRLHLMGAVVEGRLSPESDAFQRHLDRCLGCRACETVCPSGVEYGFLLERARQVAGEVRPQPLLARTLLSLIGAPRAFRAWMVASRLLRWTRIPTFAGRWVPSIGPLRTVRFGMAMLAASLPWHPPRPRERPPAVRRWGASGRAGPSTTDPGRATDAGRNSGRASGTGGGAGPSRGSGAAVVFDAERTAPPGTSVRGRVAFLSGCVQDQLFRRVNEATRSVLEANGWVVVPVPGEGCCGALHAHSGQLDRARDLARANLEAFRRAGVDWIVANAAGCGATMREYHHLMEEGNADDREAALWFSERVRDVSEILAGDGRRPKVGAPLRVRVAYDPPCHLLHGQGVRNPPLELLRSIPGLEVVEVPGGDECCGGAGIYGITHPELGGRIGDDKVAAVQRTGAHVLATGNPGCAMQIGAGLRIRGSRIRVVHPVELLAESYRRGKIT